MGEDQGRVASRSSGRWRTPRGMCFHDHALAGHPGVERTTQAARQLFWWPGVNRDIEQFVRSCVACVRAQASHLSLGGLLQPLPIPTLPWEEIAMDLIVGLPRTEEG